MKKVGLLILLFNGLLAVENEVFSMKTELLTLLFKHKQEVQQHDLRSLAKLFRSVKPHDAYWQVPLVYGIVINNHETLKLFDPIVQKNMLWLALQEDRQEDEAVAFVKKNQELGVDGYADFDKQFTPEKRSFIDCNAIQEVFEILGVYHDVINR